MRDLRELGRQLAAELRELLPIAREPSVPVPAAAVLSRTVTLPLAAERNLRAVLAFEMDRLTPFPAAQVYFDHVVLSRDARHRTVQVGLTVVPRQAVEPLLQASRSRGMEPAALEALGRRLPLDAPLDAERGWPLRTLLVAAIALLACALALPLWQKSQAIADLESALLALRKDMQAAQHARQDLAKLLSEENALLLRRAQRPPAIRTVDELTRLLPDGTWLSHLDLNGARLRVRGESPNASAVLASIERSALFTDASFEGTVTREPGSLRERFTLTATLRPAASMAESR